MNGSTERPPPATRRSGQAVTPSQPFGRSRCGRPNSATYSVAAWELGPTRICPGSASDWRRDARLTHSPTAIRWRSRSAAPRSISASPVSTPARMLIGVPDSAAQRMHADAARSALSGSAACDVGAPNRTKTASPMNFSIVPPRAVITSLIARNASSTSRFMRSGPRSRVSPVDATMSMNRQVTSRRSEWASVTSGDTGPAVPDWQGGENVMYQWIVFIHIASVLGLLLVHPVTVAFHLKEERNDTRIRELLEVSEAASVLRWAFFGLTLASGALLGFMGSWWAGAWIWAALIIFILIGVVMNLYGGRMIDRIADTRDDAQME